MSLKNLLDVRRTLAFRLTLWYAGVFLLSAAVAFGFFYYLITSTLRGRTDQDLLSEVRGFSSVMALQGVEAVKRLALLESQAAGEKKIFIQLLYPDGRVFSSSNMSYFHNIPVSVEAIGRMLDQQEPFFATVSSPDQRHEIRVVYALIGPGLIIHLGQSMDDLTRFIEAFQRIFVVDHGRPLRAGGGLRVVHGAPGPGRGRKRHPHGAAHRRGRPPGRARAGGHGRG